MGKFENGIWVAVQFLVCSHNETELAKQLVEESGLTMKDCLKAQKESGFEDVTMLEFSELPTPKGMSFGENSPLFFPASFCHCFLGHEVVHPQEGSPQA
jgi:hypothetical protein